MQCKYCLDHVPLKKWATHSIYCKKRKEIRAAGMQPETGKITSLEIDGENIPLDNQVEEVDLGNAQFISIDALTKEQLIEFAREHEIKIPKKTKKVDAIRDHIKSEIEKALAEVE